MSVDITRLTEHLSLPQQQAVRQAYRRQAQSETAAFLWCFFLGVVGAHRFYLRQWRRAVWHVMLVVALAAVIVAGVTLGWSPAITAASAVPLVLISLVWVVVDLFRIDDEVSRRNLALAEKLTGEALIDDPARGRMALDMLAAVEQREVAQPVPVAAVVRVSPDAPQVAAVAAAAPETVGIGAGVAVPYEDESATPADPDPYRTDATPVAVQTVTGIAGLAEGEGYRMIPPSEAEVEQMGGSPAIAPEPQSEVEVAEAGTPPSWSAGTVAAVASVDAAASAALAPLYRAGEEDSGLSPASSSPARDAMRGDSSSVVPDQAPTPAAPAAPAAVASAADAAGTLGLGDLPGATEAPDATMSYRANARDSDAAGARDVTDLGDDGVRFAPISDIEPESAWRLLAASPAESGSQATSPDAALLLVPESARPESLPVWPATAEWPVADMQSRPGAPAESPVSDRPGDLAPAAAAVAAGGIPLVSGGELRDEAEPDSEVAASGAEDSGSGSPTSSSTPATAAPTPTAPVTASAPEPTAPSQAAEPPRQRLKHIRVVRQVKVGDDIVEESVAEAYISPDEDPEPVRQRLREQLRREAEEKRQRDAGQ